MAIYWDDGTYLYHHGIAGQKWGIRNGPPYPLDYQYHTNRELRGEYQDVFYKKRIDRHGGSADNSKSNKTKPKKRSFKETVSEVTHSKAFKIGVAATAAALIAYGAYKYTHDLSTKVGQRYMARRYVTLSHLKGYDYVTNRMGHQYVESEYLNQLIDNVYKTDAYKQASVLINNPAITDKSLEARLKLMYGTNDNIYKDLMSSPGSEINSKALNQLLKNNNPKYGFTKDNTSNCRMCTTSLIMRLKGYNTSAGLSHTGWTDDVLSEIWSGAKVDKLNVNSYEEWYNSILKYGEGHYGDMSLSWKKGGGHSVLWLNKGGAVHIIDGQTGQEYALNELKNHINLNKTRLADITDCKITNKTMGMVMDSNSRSAAKLKIYNTRNAKAQLKAAKTLRDNRQAAFNYYKKQWGSTMSDAEIRRKVRQLLPG